MRRENREREREREGAMLKLEAVMAKLESH